MKIQAQGIAWSFFWHIDIIRIQSVPVGFPKEAKVRNIGGYADPLERKLSILPFIEFIAACNIFQPHMIGPSDECGGVQVEVITIFTAGVAQGRDVGLFLITGFLPSLRIIAAAVPAIEKIGIADGRLAEIIPQFIADIKGGGKMSI